MARTAWRQGDIPWHRQLAYEALRGEGRVYDLIIPAAFFTLSMVRTIMLVAENQSLARRGEPALVRVTNADGGPAVTLKAEYTTGPTRGDDVLIDRLRAEPSAGDVIEVVYDPENPQQVIGADRPIWQWRDFYWSTLVILLSASAAPADWHKRRERLQAGRSRSRGRHVRGRV